MVGIRWPLHQQRGLLSIPISTICAISPIIGGSWCRDSPPVDIGRVVHVALPGVRSRHHCARRRCRGGRCRVGVTPILWPLVEDGDPLRPRPIPKHPSSASGIPPAPPEAKGVGGSRDCSGCSGHLRNHLVLEGGGFSGLLLELPARAWWHVMWGGGVLPSTASVAGVGVVYSAAGRGVRPRSVRAVSSSGRAGVASVARGVRFPSEDRVLRRLALWEEVELFSVRIFSDARFSHLATQFVHSCPAFLHVQDVFRALEQQQWRL